MHTYLILPRQFFININFTNVSATIKMTVTAAKRIYSNFFALISYNFLLPLFHTFFNVIEFPKSIYSIVALSKDISSLPTVH